jgi:archaemetzincin
MEHPVKPGARGEAENGAAERWEVGPQGGVIGVVPMGAVGDAVLRILVANLQAILHLAVDLVPARPAPEYAYHTSRRQYHAALILKKLAESRHPQARLLAVVAVDLYIPVLTHVFGEAQMGGRAAVVSLQRLRERADGGWVALNTFYERVVKVGLHELGHTFDLIHCHEPECIMKYSSGYGELDALPLYFCNYCQSFLEEAYRRYGIPRLPD